MELMNYDSSNTRPDTNGFLKKSSLIIDINPDGTFTTNDESEGATVTLVAQGEYLVEGVLGFTQMQDGVVLMVVLKFHSISINSHLFELILKLMRTFYSR
ncbi:phage tail fiber protein [Proteus cibi]|uniref:phage tail fiber protein n=1 Tax=Proteus cibi TaxID=2050966 RepID=UPI0035A6123E